MSRRESGLFMLAFFVLGYLASYAVHITVVLP